jgi:hypothetical protein
VDIKQRLGNMEKALSRPSNENMLPYMDTIREVLTDARIRISDLEGSVANYGVPRETENVVRIMVALIIGGELPDHAARKAVDAYVSLKYQLKNAYRGQPENEKNV